MRPVKSHNLITRCFAPFFLHLYLRRLKKLDFFGALDGGGSWTGKREHAGWAGTPSPLGGGVGSALRKVLFPLRGVGAKGWGDAPNSPIPTHRRLLGGGSQQVAGRKAPREWLNTRPGLTESFCATKEEGAFASQNELVNPPLPRPM